MGITSGLFQVKEIKYGAKGIKGIYKGKTLIWSKALPNDKWVNENIWSNSSIYTTT